MSRPRIAEFNRPFLANDELVPPPKALERHEHVCEACGSRNAWHGHKQSDGTYRWYCPEHEPKEARG